MNKQELIKAVIELPVDCSGPRPKIDQLTTLELIKLLDEPEKVTIPQCVADWIDVCKENLAIGLYIAMNPDFLKQYNKSNELITWIRKHKNQDIFARAWLDGYEVEKETKYTVKVKATKQYLCNDELGPHFSPSFRSNFTKTNLEELGFGWVFDCEGVEVEEV